jgi:3-deoxy-manno-octulosonate cytidylyltransferase (CMP-KDO synthetase)
MDVLCVLPARLDSRRIPHKSLQLLAGRPLIEWTWNAASRVAEIDRLLVATDSAEIAACVTDFGGEAILTAEHRSGTDRVAEAARSVGAADLDIVVNFQADEPFADPSTVGRAVQAVATGRAEIATLAAPIRTLDEWGSEGVVKVVVDRAWKALYFSRAPIPHPRGETPVFTEGETRYLRHVGIYVQRLETLERWSGAPESRLEAIERLEQLRALEAGIRVHVELGPSTEPGVDLPGDLERAARHLERTARQLEPGVSRSTPKVSHGEADSHV